MSNLSPEERKKIYEEEKARLEAQKELQKQEKQKAAKSTNTGCLILIGLAIVGIVGYYISESGSSSGGPSGTSPSQSLELNAAVRFTGTQFIIQNKDSFAWQSVKLEINGGLLRGGYVYRADRIEAGTTATIGAMQFAKSSGERFNPVLIKAQSFDITCDTLRGMGIYSGAW